jgi:predicted heme/steroid binding protein
MRRFSRAELSKYHGRRIAPAFIACQGKVYDVSQSFLWRGGEHQVIHLAGSDLTHSIHLAPHGQDLLLRFPIVGELVES